MTRLRAAWRAAHEPVPGAPHWAVRLAYVVPFVVLPASIWRISVVVFHAPLVRSGAEPGGGIRTAIYVIFLSVLSEALAFTAVGLVARWGEVFPGWVPVLRGRRVPPGTATVAGGIGAAVLTVLWTVAAVAIALGRTITGGAPPDPETNPLLVHDWHFYVLIVSYAPLLLWGPLLAAVTVAYWQRRRPGVALVAQRRARET